MYSHGYKNINSQKEECVLKEVRTYNVNKETCDSDEINALEE